MDDVQLEYNKVKACMQPFLKTTAWYLLIVTNKTHNIAISELPHNVGILDRFALPQFLGPIAHAFLGGFLDAPATSARENTDGDGGIAQHGSLPVEACQ